MVTHYGWDNKVLHNKATAFAIILAYQENLHGALFFNHPPYLNTVTLILVPDSFKSRELCTNGKFVYGTIAMVCNCMPQSKFVILSMYSIRFVLKTENLEPRFFSQWVLLE